MAFIENGSGFTLGEGTCNNIHGDLNIYHGTKRRREEVDDTLLWEAPVLKRRREEEEDELEVIRQRDLSLLQELGGGLGYLFHAGKVKDRAVIVKVFNTGARAREHLEATVALSKGLLHPNVLQIQGTASPTSPSQFIAYEDAHWKNAAGSLAEVLRDDLDRSVVLGFKLVAGLSSGINYLSAQDLPLALVAADFDVFLDLNDRFLLSINPPSNTTGPTQRGGSGWTLFNALCQKVLRSANRVLHDDDIARTPVVFNTSALPNSVTGSPTALEHSNERIDVERDVRAVAPRREYIWRTMALQQPLATIAAHINRDLDVRRTPIRRLLWTNAQNTHRCPGYLREEITLATRTVDSAVVVHDSPDPQEVCPICHQVVSSAAVSPVTFSRRNPELLFSCPVPGCRSTFARSFLLQSHIRSHTHHEMAPFLCKWPGCGKRFVQERYCKRHEQLHRSFACRACNERFASMGARDRHLRSEGGAECRRMLGTQARAFRQGQPVIPSPDLAFASGSF
ncbi:hypothetical protein FB45DRAFT_1017279 [Roridomyces roridus]|uniref:C2H2-type domain-containing protein n=1 Tax=Roridomyces roridus TaxID=1738132 RepID=A0AAD7FYC6_9AGAR|nr:hypothetical protein FB45DRAFT_1017279 [Roridomyces roridus]